MKRILQLLAVLVLLAAGTTWLATGANRGWTKTSRPNGTVDEVTGIMDQTPVNCFVAGVDFLGAAALTSGILAGASFFFRNKKQNQP
ncbi:MAG TPA: hypothetical protein VFC17_12280 [Candidatus Limnocylindrales bacterium]|nr:hypothetical protein [Candidatus Limnocylindrales bacterium]